MERALVTGGAGFIGSHTVDVLLERGYEVRILDSLQPRVHPRGTPPWVQDVELIVGDVANPNDLARALDGVRYVFHLAAYQDYLPDFSTFVHTNTESTALLYELIVTRHLPVQKIVFASSQSVCGEGPYRCAQHGVVVPDPRPLAQLERGDWEIHCPRCGGYMESLLTDESTVSPGTTYGISKYAIELLADRLGRRYGIPSVCMRYTYVQGPRNSFFNTYSGIARRFAVRLLHNLPPIVFEDGQQKKDFINVRDVARANMLVMEREGTEFQIYNVGGGRAITVLEFAHKMLAECKMDLEPLVSGEFRFGDTRHTVSDISRLRALGWEPTIPVERNIAEYMAWIKEQPGVKEYVDEADRVMRDQGVVRSSRART